MPLILFSSSGVRFEASPVGGGFRAFPFGGGFRAFSSVGGVRFEASPVGGGIKALGGMVSFSFFNGRKC